MRPCLSIAIGLLALPYMTLEAEPVVLQQVTDIKQAWTPGHQLYVKGDVPVSENSLLELEAWLQGHPHWTVVLADTAKGETYQAADGTVTQGNKAVAYVMGTGLPQTDEGTLTDPATRLADGASLVVQIKDHHLNYSASAEQEKYSVGTEKWAGNLDQLAIHDLRSGFRIVPAVEDTISFIDRTVADRVAVENRDFDAAALTAENKFNEVQADLGIFQKNHPEASGPIYHPTLDHYQSQITTAVQQRDLGQIKQIETDLDGIQTALGTYEKDLATYNGLVGEKPGDTAALERAHNELLQGDTGAAEQHFQAIRQAIDQKSAAQEETLALGILGSLIFLGFGFLILVGVLLKMWAVRTKRNLYLDTIQTWKAALVAKTDGLFDLDKGLEGLALTPPDLMGSAQKLYEGTSLEQVLKALKTKDELYIMSSYLHDLYDKARAQVDRHPAENWILDRNYRKALSLLKSEPIRFQHNDPLRTLSLGGHKIDALLGRPEDYAEFTATADQLFDKFEALATPTLTVLATLRNASESLREGLAQLKRDEQELGGIPFAPIDEDEVNKLALRDPLGALDLLESQGRQIALLKATKAALRNAQDEDIAHLSPQRQGELNRQREAAEAYLKNGDGERAREGLKVFEHKRGDYQEEWQRIEDLTNRQTALQGRLKNEIEKHRGQPWVQEGRVETAKNLLEQANGYAGAGNLLRSQQIYNQVSTIQSEWTDQRQAYLRAQSELERLRRQTQNSGVGYEHYREAENRFYQGDYSNTLIYTALAFQAMEDFRLEAARSEPMIPDAYLYNNPPTYTNTDSPASSPPPDSSWGVSDSGSGSSDFGSSDSGSSGSNW